MSQPQELAPYSETTAAPGGYHYEGLHEHHHDPEHDISAEELGDHPHKKKSVIGKVKDKAKKLKTKIHMPKAHGAAEDSNDETSSRSGSDDEGRSEEHWQQSGEQTGEERDVVLTPGLKGESYEAIPDPNVGDANGVHMRFEHPKVLDEPETMKLQDEVPCAPGQASAGVTPYLAIHDLAQSPAATGASANVTPPVKEGKNSEGKDLFVAPDQKEASPADSEQPSDVSIMSDKSAASYTPMTAETTPKADQQKSMKDQIVEGANAAKDNVAAVAASGAAALGLTANPATGRGESAQQENARQGQASMLAQVKEKILGVSPKRDDHETAVVGDNKPTMTSRAAETAAGIKDTIAAKLGYGSSKSLDSSSTTADATSQVDAPDAESESALKRVQEKAESATGGVTSKLGHSEKQSTSEGDQETTLGENKSYAQRASEAVLGAKDAVAMKLGYGGTFPKSEDKTPELPGGEDKPYIQRVSEGVLGAKDTAAAKLGYGGTSPKDARAETAGENKSYTQKLSETMQEAKDAAAAKLGYGDAAPREEETVVVEGQGEDHKSYLQKVQETAKGASEAVRSKMGYGNRGGAEAGADESHYGGGGEQNAPGRKAARFHPGEEDTALSQLITEKMSMGAATVKDTLLRPFSAAKSGPPTPTTTPPPSSAVADAGEPAHAGKEDAAPQRERGGIVGKMTGAVSSLLGSPASAKKEVVEEAAGKASEDPQASVETH